MYNRWHTQKTCKYTDRQAQHHYSSTVRSANWPGHYKPCQRYAWWHYKAFTAARLLQTILVPIGRSLQVNRCRNRDFSGTLYAKLWQTRPTHVTIVLWKPSNCRLQVQMTQSSCMGSTSLIKLTNKALDPLKIVSAMPDTVTKNKIWINNMFSINKVTFAPTMWKAVTELTETATCMMQWFTGITTRPTEIMYA